MIHYHGTPVGGKREDAAKFLAGRHALVPFPRKDDLGIVADVCKSFVFDNGAFTVWKKGGQVDVEGYTRWVEDWHRHPGFTWALIPDVIDGDEEANDDLVRQWPEELRGVPVWHLHESLERLQRLARCWRTVALGSSGQWSSPGTGAWWKRMGIARCWKRLSSSPVEERSIRPADVRPAQAMGSYTESVEYPSSPAIQLSSHLCDNMHYVWHEPRLHLPAARP